MSTVRKETQNMGLIKVRSVSPRRRRRMWAVFIVQEHRRVGAMGRVAVRRKEIPPHCYSSSAKPPLPPPSAPPLPPPPLNLFLNASQFVISQSLLIYSIYKAFLLDKCYCTVITLSVTLMVWIIHPPLPLLSRQTLLKQMLQQQQKQQRRQRQKPQNHLFLEPE